MPCQLTQIIIWLICINPIGGLLSGCAMWYYMFDAQMFLQPQFIPDTEHTLSTVLTFHVQLITIDYY